jgi:hypothetical protein
MSISPTAEGFRAVFRQPSLAVAEITWRWVTGATASAVVIFGLFEYLNSLPVTSGELLFLRSRQPYLVSEAIAHILRGSLGRVVLSVLVAAITLGWLWMFAGAVGRIATVRAMIDRFRGLAARSISGSTDDAMQGGDGNVAANISAYSASTPGPMRAIVRLNFLRAITAIAAIVGVVGASILAGFVSPESHPRPGLTFILFLPMAVLICLAWYGLNWLLSLASIFAVRDGKGVAGAISTAIDFCRERTGAVAAVSTWFWLAHFVAFVAASTVISMPLGFAPIVSWRLVVFVMLLLSLAYFALADWLYTARLAGYVCIAEMPEVLLKSPSLPAPTFTPPFAMPPSAVVPATPVLHTIIDRGEAILSDAPAPQTTIDHDEVILSDVPNPERLQ